MKRSRLIIIILSIILIVILIAGILISKKNIIFTESEILWMKEHPIIYVAPDPEYGPIEFFDENGNFKGVAADYINWIDSVIPIKLEVIRYETWPEALSAIKLDEVDILSAAIKTEQREEYLDFSDVYFSVPNVIVAKSDYKGRVKLEDLVGKEVLVIEDYATEDYLTLNHPEINIVTVRSTVEGLSLVSLGTYDYMVVSLAQASYYLEESKITNIKVCGEMDFENEVAFGVREEYKELVPILNKALESMPRKLEDSIYVKWINLDLSNGISKEVVIIIVVSVIIIISVIAVIVFLNHLLQVRVREKTEELNNELEERKKIEKDLATLNEHLEDEVNLRTIELQKAFDDLKKIQKDLIESEKLASLSKILINISHNLNTPIGSAITLNSFEEMIIDKIIKSNTNENILKYLDQLKNSNDLTAQELIKAKDFIVTMKSTMNIKVDDTKIKINICDYLSNLKLEYQDTFADKNIKLYVTCDEKISLKVSKENLDNIFNNLIKNSLEFGFENSESGNIKIDARSEENEIRFIYKDDGVGIKNEISKNIFDPLFTTKMGRTSGLGLNILYNTVKLVLNGHVEFRSNLGEGVEFSITFNNELGRNI